MNGAFPALFALSLLCACGGGNGSEVVAAPPGSETTTSTGTPESASAAPPNFVVIDIVTSAETTSGKRLSVSASVANVGEGEAVVPEGWFIVSTNEDFLNGYVAHAVTLRTAGGGDQLLEPGENRVYEVANESGRVRLRQQRYGTHYARLWLNPDRSANFTNPGNVVTPNHASVESNYADNLSPTVAFERPRTEGEPSSECLPDAFEENDSFEAATPIALDTTYTINSCDDELDVFAAELVPGQVVELVMDGNASHLYQSAIGPDGTYLVRDAFGGGFIVRAESPGKHRFVFRPVPFAVEGSRETSFSVNSLR